MADDAPLRKEGIKTKTEEGRKKITIDNKKSVIFSPFLVHLFYSSPCAQEQHNRLFHAFEHLYLQHNMQSIAREMIIDLYANGMGGGG